MLLNPPKRLRKEFLDTPGQDPDELWGLLQDIQRTNRRFGGQRLILSYLSQFAARILTRPLSILDVATASADIPRAIVDWARGNGLEVRIVALDLSDEILTLAQRDLRGYPEITLARADAMALPYPSHAFDVVICGLALHHFTESEAVQVLREVDRVARMGFVVNDILRSWGALAGVWLDTRLLSRNRLARHDGPLSVLRAYTLGELRPLLVAAGLNEVDIRRHPMFRVALVRWPP